MSRHNGTAEVRGVKYILAQQTAQQAKTTPCTGCVAQGKASLCERLPSSCVTSDAIWRRA